MRCFIFSFALIMLKLALGQNLKDKIPVFPDNIIGERTCHWISLLIALACRKLQFTPIKISNLHCAASRCTNMRLHSLLVLQLQHATVQPSLIGILLLWKAIKVEWGSSSCCKHCARASSSAMPLAPSKLVMWQQRSIILAVRSDTCCSKRQCNLATMSRSASAAQLMVLALSCTSHFTQHRALLGSWHQR
jgi:hypothetical protein